MKISSRVQSTSLPLESTLAPTFARADLADAFVLTIPNADKSSVDDWAHAVLDHPSPMLRGLLTLRDTLVAPLGLKTSRALRTSLRNRAVEHMDFFQVRSRSPNEIVLGEDDSHLDFRLSLLLRASSDNAARQLVATTVVHCHNLTGRAYLALITPFHKRVVIQNLKRAMQWMPRSTVVSGPDR